MKKFWKMVLISVIVLFLTALTFVIWADINHYNKKGDLFGIEDYYITTRLYVKLTGK